MSPAAKSFLACFGNTNYHALIECIDSCCSTDTARYPPVLAGDYLSGDQEDLHMRNTQHDVLFEPVDISPVSQNRFYQVPHCTDSAGCGPKWPQR